MKMDFTTALNFPETFIIGSPAQGSVYKLDLSDVLTQSEISAKLVQAEYQLERKTATSS